MYGKPVHVHSDMAKNEVHRPQVGAVQRTRTALANDGQLA